MIPEKIYVQQYHQKVERTKTQSEHEAERLFKSYDLWFRHFLEQKDI